MTEHFQHLQQRFAGHIREPSVPAPPGIEDRRLAVYRELFFNNVEGFLASGFPVLRSLYADDVWLVLARSFFAHHRCRTPYFLEIAEEFLAWLEREHAASEDDPPFLLELAHYEWVELALSVAEDTTDMPDVDPHGDLLDGAPVLSPLAWPLAYRYPVQHIGPDHRPMEPLPEAQHLLAWRDAGDQVRFMEINAVTARLLTLMQERPDDSGRVLLEMIAAELGHPQPQVVIDGGHAILAQLREGGAVLGIRRGARQAARD